MQDFFDEYEKLKKEQMKVTRPEIFAIDNTDELLSDTNNYMSTMQQSKLQYRNSGFIDSFKPLDAVTPELRNPHRLSAGGLLTPGMNLLAGDPKVGKTTFLAQLVLSIASGRPILGLFDVVKAKCGLIELEENEEKLSRMIRDLAPALGISAKEYIEIAQTNIMISSTSVESHEQLCSELYQMYLAGIKVVFIDTLGKLQESMQVSSNAYKQEAFLYGTVDRIAATLGISLVYLHHTNKAVQRNVTATQRVNGSNALIGAAQNIITLERRLSKKHGDKFYMVYEGRANNPFVAEIERSQRSVKYWTLHPQAQLEVVTTVQEWIRDIVFEKRNDGATLQEIQQKLFINSNTLILGQFTAMLERGELYVSQIGTFMYNSQWENEIKCDKSLFPELED